MTGTFVTIPRPVASVKPPQPPSGQQTQFEKSLATAERHYRAGRYTKARRALTVPAATPRAAARRLAALARICNAQHEFVQAVEHPRAAHELRPGNRKILLFYFERLVFLYNFRAASKVYRRMSAAQQDDQATKREVYWLATSIGWTATADQLCDEAGLTRTRTERIKSYLLRPVRAGSAATGTT